MIIEQSLAPHLECCTRSEALQQWEAEEPEAAKVVKLRYFAALTIEDTALALGLSVRTVNRHWAFARAWLHDRLR
ncbi:ECF-type sigma factor [Lacipirellula limnantheis]|uniref:ECF-type sigma factor n=1 Tax=Lacipirellula limnantheis TaxID=2528024 RepID=UPI0011AA6B9B|nr:ECF-type sigma factor [Lacipirellula limnantheis]